jgi:hypothetical protein
MATIEEFLAKYQEVKEARKKRDPKHWWIVPLDQVILDACARQRDHKDVSEVYTKVALVNRMYRAKLLLKGGDAEWEVARAFVE